MTGKRHVSPSATVHQIWTRTGHVGRTQRKEVDNAVIEALRPVVQAGGGLIAQLGLTVDFQDLLDDAVLYRLEKPKAADPPAVAGIMCWARKDSDEACTAAREQARRLGTMLQTVPPRGFHWLTVTPGPQMAALPRDVAATLDAMQRCLYWTAVHYWHRAA